MPSSALTEVADGIYLNALRDWVRHRFGISYGSGLETIFADRVGCLCQSLDTTPAELLSALAAGDQRITLRFCEAVSTNYTFFFREWTAFATLIDEILPSLPDGPIRMWSAATSSGEEAYSMAITTCEALGVETARHRVRILGTDISSRQLHTAERAIYPIPQIVGDAWERIAPWAVRSAMGQFQLVPEVREMCVFRRMNLIQQAHWPFEQRFHVIFLRNVLYYFEPATQQRILQACYAATEPGGWLITSLTEPVLELAAPWQQIHTAIYRRQG